METQIKEFFTTLNNETSCLFYAINMKMDGEVHIRWKDLTHLDYHIPPSDVYNRINIRIQKANNHMYFLDFYQYYKEKMEWIGVRFKSCIGYNVEIDEDGRLTATFRFHSICEGQIQIVVKGISIEVVFLLQEFLSSFL